ncbi:MAG: YbhB/YbcL family Raf kinase inhibitor-like protein [Gemmatimonadaceae bacterium]
MFAPTHSPRRVRAGAFTRVAAAAITAALAAAVTMAPAQAVAQGRSSGAPAGRFMLTSPDVRAGSTIGAKHVFKGMGCSGENISPALAWRGAPAATKSYAVTVYDPDAPTGSGWWHWMVYNIPASATGLQAGAGDAAKGLAPTGSMQGPTDFGAPGYGGPCPPPGSKPHRYIFTVFALKTDRLEIPAGATSAMVGFNINANVLAKATLTAVYRR